MKVLSRPSHKLQLCWVRSLSKSCFSQGESEKGIPKSGGLGILPEFSRATVNDTCLE